VYEPDNSQPKAIALSQPQLHNFYPDGDVDTATFLAKAQHYYRIYTADLAIGVDTVMNVQAGGLGFNNDDSKPGSLYSEIVFQNTNPADVMAVITLYNRGQFGSDKSYRLIVEEVIMLATSTPTVQPTNTLTPSPTATADLRDSYEPDGTTPKPIALGEIQTHNFYPTGDIDKISFVVKGGHYYQVLTSDLAIGVDTSVTVSLDGSQWTNDDYAAKGSNIFASAVCFQASQDGTASAAVSNMAKMYAPDKTYRIRVSEVATLNASPCLPVATPAARNSVDTTNAMHSVVWITTNEEERMLSADAAMSVRFVIILELKVIDP